MNNTANNQFWVIRDVTDNVGRVEFAVFDRNGMQPVEVDGTANAFQTCDAAVAAAMEKADRRGLRLVGGLGPDAFVPRDGRRMPTPIVVGLLLTRAS